MTDNGTIGNPAAAGDDAAKADSARANAGVRGLALSRPALIGFGIAGLVAAVSLAGSVVFGWRYHNDRLVDQARGAAQTAASAQATAMLSYDYQHASQQLDQAANGLTGDFRDTYRQLVDTTVAPGAEQKQIAVKAQVRAAGATSVSANSATVLVFLNQATTSKDDPKAVITWSRVEMRLRKVDGRWLTSSFNPL